MIEQAEELKELFKVIDEKQIASMISDSPFETENDMFNWVLAATMPEWNPVEFAKVWGVSEAAAIWMFSHIVSNLVVPVLNEEAMKAAEEANDH